jgi:RNA polymerase sigma factor for flagellar operon FliA
MKSAKKAYQTQSTLDPAERERLLLEHLPQVRYIARRIHDRLPSHVDLEDLVNTGVLGLVEALHKYDPAKDVQLASYAKFRIRGAILDSLRKLDWAPRNLRKKAREIEETLRKLQTRLGRAATEGEIAAEMGMEQGKYQQLMGELKGLELGHIEDLSPEGGEDLDLTRYMPNAPEQDPFFICARSEMREILTMALGELPPRERQVLALYYYEELTLKEVGAVIGVNESRVSQIHSAAMVRLRARMQQLLESKTVEPAPVDDKRSETKQPHPVVEKQ